MVEHSSVAVTLVRFR
jgi:hypothetical protein